MKNTKVIIRKTSKTGLGVLAIRNIKKGDVIHEGKPISLSKQRTSHSFQVHENTHVQLDKLSRSINHSCEPNAGIRSNTYLGYNFIALRNIKMNEQITWDYETTEYESISVGKCLCGSLKCRGKTQGFRYLSSKIIKSYNGYIADYLKSKNVL